MMHAEGTYTAVIQDHGFSTSTKGTDQFWAKFGTDADEDNTIVGYFPFTEKSAEYTIEKIRSMGYQGDDLSRLEDGKELYKNLCQITVKHEVYNGKTSAKVVFVNPFGYVGGPSRDEKAALNTRRFNALLKKAAKSEQIKEGYAANTSETKESSAPNWNTDNPFDERNPPSVY